MARPRLHEKRDQQLNLKLTRREMAWVRAAAEVANMQPVDFGRARLLADAPMFAKPDPWAQEQTLLRVQLARLGNNLNQIARIMHANGGVPPQELTALLRDIRAVFNRSEVA